MNSFWGNLLYKHRHRLLHYEQPLVPLVERLYKYLNVEELEDNA